MATPTYALKPGGTHLHVWTLTTADPTGDAIEFPGAADRTVQFVSSAWGSATAVLEGSLDSGVTWFGLSDPQGTAISKTADGGEAVLENTLQVRAKLSAVGVGATVKAYLLSRSSNR